MIKYLRSLIQEQFPLDLRYQLELLSRRRDIINKEKHDELFKILREFELNDFVQLGPGTNRMSFKLNGFAIKIATDNDGKIDNFKEFKMSRKLFPKVTKTYEVSKNGTILVAEYIQPYVSYSEMNAHADQIREILDELSKVYLIGDVGITSKNFANWGSRIGSDIPVCLDYAYVYDVSSSLFICPKCKTNSMLLPDRNYTKLVCSNRACNSEFSFEDIRRRISNDAHLNEIGDLSKDAYMLSASNVETELSPERSRYLMKYFKKKELSDNELFNEEETPDTFVMEHEPNYYINKQKSEEDNMGNLILEARLYGEEMSKHIKTTVVGRPIKNTKEEKKVDLVYREPSAINVIAKPIQNNTTLAFKSEMNPSDSIDNLIDNIPSIANLDANEELLDIDESDDNNENSTSSYPPQFINNIHKAISKLSNKIKDNLYAQEFYDVIRPELTNTENFYAGDFYKIVQNAVFRSITIFLNMKESSVINQKTGKPITIYNAPEDLDNPKYQAMLKFIERFWLNRSINNFDDAKDIMASYKNTYSDYIGLDRNWLPVFRARLASNLKIADKFTIQKISDTIANDWCYEYEVKNIEAAEAKDEIKNARSAFEDNILALSELNENSELSDLFEDVEDSEEFIDSSDIKKSEVNKEVITEVYEESDEEEDSSLISVEIYPHKKLDLVKVKYFDEIQKTITVDCKLSDYDNTDLGSLVHHPLSGVWNWLSYIDPDFIFSTINPEYWLEKNNSSNNNSKFYKYAIITAMDNSYIMGLYCLEGIYINEHGDDLDLTNDPNILRQLNNLLTSELSIKMPHPEKHFLEKYTVHTEDEFKDFLNDILKAYDLNDDTSESEEDIDEINPIDYMDLDEKVEPENSDVTLNEILGMDKVFSDDEKSVSLDGETFLTPIRRNK